MKKVLDEHDDDDDSSNLGEETKEQQHTPAREWLSYMRGDDNEGHKLNCAKLNKDNVGNFPEDPHPLPVISSHIFSAEKWRIARVFKTHSTCPIGSW